MIVWRICKTKHANAPLDGMGGMSASGRWHRKGTPIVYTSTSPSLAALETLVHFDPSLQPSLTLLEIDVPDILSIERCDPTTLTADWRAYPGVEALQTFGTSWAKERRSALLQVPSALLYVGRHVESNYLINPEMVADEVRTVDRVPFAFDPRLLR